MRKIIIVSLMGVLLLPAGCRKNQPAAQKDSIATKYAKYRTAAYSDPLLTKWSAMLEKGEPVELLEEQTIVKNKAEIKLSKVRLTDDTTAFIEQKSLAVRPVVFTANDLPVYNRNNISSGIFATIPAGTVGFVTEEKAEWSQIDIGLVGKKQIYGKWVKDGINADPQMVADAVSLEKIRNVLTETVQGDKNEAKMLLKTIAEKNTIIGTLAKEDLSKMESPPAQAQSTAEQEPQTQQ